jgi:hypothetical protein
MTQITAAEMVAVAKEQVGYIEPSNGRTKFGTWYGDEVNSSAYDAAAWCDMFICWCASLAGWRKGGKQGKANAIKQVGGLHAYTPSHAGFFAQRSRFNNVPYVGSLVFFDWAGSKRLNAIDHIGLVIGSTGREVITIEGNTLKGSRPGVHKRYRDRATIAGFAHPYYVKAASTAASAGNSAPKGKTPKFPLSSGHYFGTRNGSGSHNGTTASDVPKIKQLQERLNDVGYKLTLDGEYGPKTAAAVKDFQRDAHLAVDGLAGTDTWTALWTTTP